MLNVLTLGALALCLTAATFWVRSRWIFEEWSVRLSATRLAVRSDRDTLEIIRSAPWPPDTRLTFHWSLRQDASLIDFLFSDDFGRNTRTEWSAPGLEATSGTELCISQLSMNRANVRSVRINYGLIITVAAMLPLISCMMRLRRRSRGRQRLRSDQCVGCGYDLRGTPGRCPECGQIAAKALGWVRRMRGEFGNSFASRASRPNYSIQDTGETPVIRNASRARCGACAAITPARRRLYSCAAKGTT